MRQSRLGTRELLASIEADRLARQKAAWFAMLALAAFAIGIAFSYQYLVLVCLDHIRSTFQAIH